MAIGEILIVLCLSAPNPLSPEMGSIGGLVVNVTQGETPVPGATVVLRVKLDGQFVVAAQTTSDEHGRFLFDELPGDDDYLYLPGANRAEVHYPGPPVRLNRRRPDANVTLRVHDTVTQPNPLVVRRHDVFVHPEPGALRVTEMMLIENLGMSTYVGQASKPNGRAATLALSIPADFVRCTFHTEFFGRHFTMIDDKLVTDVPWMPGMHELKFTYVLPNVERRRLWKRPLDLPTSNLRITVVDADTGQVACNLEPGSSERAGETVFASRLSLDAGHVIRLELSRLPLPFMAYAGWVAVMTILASIVGTRYLLRRWCATDVGHRGVSLGTPCASDREPKSERSAYADRPRRKQKQLS